MPTKSAQPHHESANTRSGPASLVNISSLSPSGVLKMVTAPPAPICQTSRSSSPSPPLSSSHRNRLRIVTLQSPRPVAHMYPTTPEYKLLSRPSIPFRISQLLLFGAPV